jgi:hypothetical protein
LNLSSFVPAIDRHFWGDLRHVSGAYRSGCTR